MALGSEQRASIDQTCLDPVCEEKCLTPAVNSKTATPSPQITTAETLSVLDNIPQTGDSWTERILQTIPHNAAPDHLCMGQDSNSLMVKHNNKQQNPTITNAVTPPNKLAVDYSDNLPEIQQDTLFPLHMLGRCSSGIAESRTRQLFERHGLTYHSARAVNGEPTAKVRRIDRPVRMRVRWSCHACHATFAANDACRECGHERCVSCERFPARRKPKVLSMENRMKKELRALERNIAVQREALMFEHNNGIDPAVVSRATQQHEIQQSAGASESHLSRAHLAHRECHECESSVDCSLSNCQTCGHLLCALCNQYDGTATGVEAKIQLLRARVPERIHRRPRQRVRYTCEQCEKPFKEEQECSGCGHSRCSNCPRFPPRRGQIVDTHKHVEVQAESIIMKGSTDGGTSPERVEARL